MRLHYSGRNPFANGLTEFLLKLDYSLLLRDTGSTIAGVMAVLALISTGAGVVLRWPRNGRWRIAFSMRRPVRQERSNSDIHRLYGIARHSPALRKARSAHGASDDRAETSLEICKFTSEAMGLQYSVHEKTTVGRKIRRRRRRRQKSRSDRRKCHRGELAMRDLRCDTRRLIAPLQFHLPLSDGAAAPLVTILPAAFSTSSRCMVTQVFDAGNRLGLMRQLEFDDETRRSTAIVVSLTQSSVDRKLPFHRDIAACRKSRRERACLFDEPIDSVERQRDDSQIEPLVRGHVGPLRSNNVGTTAWRSA